MTHAEKNLLVINTFKFTVVLFQEYQQEFTKTKAKTLQELIIMVGIVLSNIK